MTEEEQKQTQRQTAQFLRQQADNIEEGKVDWVWIALKYPAGRITYSTEGAPKRPQGMT